MLIVGVVLTGYLLLLQWQEDYVNTPPVPEVSPDYSTPDTPSGAAPSANPPAPRAEAATDLPSVPEQQRLPAKPAESDGLTIIPGGDTAAVRGNYIVAESDVIRIEIDPRGGDIVRAQLKQYKEQRGTHLILSLLRQDNGRFAIAQSGLIGQDGPDNSPDGRPLYESRLQTYKMQDGENILRIPLTYRKEGVTLTKEFLLRRGRYDTDISFKVENNGDRPWLANLFAQFRRDDKSPLYDEETFGVRSFKGAALTTAGDNYKKVSFGDMEKRELFEEVEGGWMAMVQHYFVAAWVPADTGKTYIYRTRQTANRQHYIFGFTAPAFQVLPGQQKTETVHLYLGPKIQKPLEDLAPYLALTIDYGWLWYISQPLFGFLTFIHKYVNNWGLAIILMTLVIKIVFFPLTNTSYRSMARMRKLQPQMKAIREAHADNRRQMQEEMMRLYKREKVNPMGGCLPILIQMPIFISFYWTLIESVELRHSPFFGWITDLTSQDPYFILPVLMGASMFVQQQLSPTPPDPTQARVMKFLPVIFTIFFLWFPSGLVLYWLINNILSIGQQYLITARLNKTPDSKPSAPLTLNKFLNKPLNKFLNKLLKFGKKSK